MNVTITLSMDTVAFEAESELDRVLATVPGKIRHQMAREPGCICTHPEDDDVLRDINGNVVGSVKIEPHP